MGWALLPERVGRCRQRCAQRAEALVLECAWMCGHVCERELRGCALPVRGCVRVSVSV
jgi:hypothetical protein